MFLDLFLKKIRWILLWRKRARLTDLSFLNTISPVLCPIWDGVKLNLYSISKNSWAQSSAWVDYLGLRSLVWTSLQSSWAWWRTKRLTVLVLWLEHWPHGTSCAVGMYWRYLGWADPMRSHSFNQSIAELWWDQPPFCWTAPTGNVNSPLLPAESPSNGYYTTTTYY